VHSLAWFEQTALSIWVREEWWIFPTILSIHSIGMGLSAGVNFAISLRMLGVAPRVSLLALSRFIPLVWFGLIANTLSGLLLLAGYPAKALTNPVFYVKLVLLLAGLWLMSHLERRVLNDPRYATEVLPSKLKRLAVIALLVWIGVIFTGRFLAYTHSVLLASWLV
jgi:hypothetical protein